MTAPGRPPEPSPRGALGARWARRPPVLRGRSLVAVIGLLVVLVGVVAWRLAGSSDDGLPAYTAEFDTIDGSSYRLTVVPSSEPLTEASPDGCYGVPAAGHANLGFDVRIENRSSGSAPMPDVVFAVNANGDGVLDQSAESRSGNNRQIEVTPRAENAACDETSGIHPTGRPELGKGETATFRGIVGGIVTPVSPDLQLLIRYVQADTNDPSVAGSAELDAPFPVGAK